MSQKTLEDMRTISPELLEKLSKAGFTTVESLCWLSAEELIESVSIKHEIAQLIIDEAKTLVEHQPVSAVDLLEKEEKRQVITTSSTQLDDLLGDGIYTGEITEISGEFASGKTQICFQLSVNVQLSKEMGGIEGTVYYIDTEGTFSSTRIAQIANERDLNAKAILKNIAVTRTYNSDHLMFLIQNS
ncbi:MAG: DNA repair and recombination protein RadA, partial [Candidatus Heimdallarchaeota archaeon]